MDVNQHVSFARQVKLNLSETEPTCPHCQFAQAYGMLVCSRGFSHPQISIQTEHKAVVDTFVSLLIDLTGSIVTILHDRPSHLQRGRLYTAVVEDDRDNELIRERFGHIAGEKSLHIRRENFSKSCCQSAFLRGAFLVCGTMINPEREYHAEFVLPTQSLGSDFREILTDCGIEPKCTIRKGSSVVYIKESEQIEDLLTLMGDSASALSIMNIKIVKDVRNKVNRVTNCETANIGKTVSAASGQIADIQRIERHKGLASLPDELREIAELRLENPDMSLRELGGMLSEPLSRSGVNHRLQRLHEIASGLHEMPVKKV